MATRCLFVASTGGHLEELKRLRPALVPADAEVHWVTFESVSSRSSLASEPHVHFVPDVPPRGLLPLLKAFWPALRVLLRVRPTLVYSTGAAIALAVLPFAFLVRARATYIESATRTDGPSVTGRMLTCVPWLRLRTQYQKWAGRRWKFSGSVFDQWHVVAAPKPRTQIRKILVTLGTQRDFPFLSLVQRIQKIVPPGVEVFWQLGGGFPEDARPDGARDTVSFDQMREWVRSADAIVAHAGVGSALTLLVPRSASRGEHVDDHQEFLAEELVTRGLAVVASPDDLSWDDLLESMTYAVQPVVRPLHNELLDTIPTDDENVVAATAA
jgi:UDP-N-acetylglucosamine--N-acetylmuramyl-(pentapeptide) pyrophosphoryl-undecaprenol N-acetylglucosamine transferase